MAEKNLVEETLVQIQNLEEVINENAKEILASTMKEEISELVKESMKDETNEAEEDDMDSMDDMDIEDNSEDLIGGDDENEDEMDMDIDMDINTEDSMDLGIDDDMGMGMSMDDFSDDETIDLTGASDDEVLKVFKAMSADDEITVTKDGDYIHLVDEPEDNEYIIQTESEEDELEETIYEVDEMDEMDELEESWSEESNESKEDELEETIYEIEMEESDEYEFQEDMNMTESKKIMSTPKVAGGAKTGKQSKFSYKKSKGGFKEDMPKANPTKGTGKPKFEFKESEKLDSQFKTKPMSKEEAKEAARTYSFGSKDGSRGLRKGITPNRDMTFESVTGELNMLRTKNEEYRKALNLFRDKLNEVAVFNSNLAYATRLFTEHSTSKQEKINILRRFDTSETLKESKALYKTIKDELSGKESVKSINESFERVIDQEPQSGSAVNLIESKTYENPQFLRMKDIMQKLIK